MKILLIRYSSLGDVILTTSAARNIKKYDPAASVNVLTKEIYKPVFFNNPDISGVITALNRRIVYDVLIDLHNSIRSNLVKYLIPARKRLTYDKAAYARRLFVKTGRKHEILDTNVIERYIKPLGEIGIGAEYMCPRIYVTEEELSGAMNKYGIFDYVALAPGAKWLTKQWSLENYISLTVKIIRDLGCDVVIAGDSSDCVIADEIYRGAGILKSHVKNIAGKTDLRELAAVLKNAMAVVSTDSGPMHMGWAVGAKVIALFGPTVKEFGFQPRHENVVIIEKSMECRPCSLHGSQKCQYGDIACMQRIEVNEVFEEVKKALPL
jgi:heptosyltransferase-2